MTRYRLDFTDAHPDDASAARQRRWLKNADLYGFRAGPVMPLSDTSETPRALAERMVTVVEDTYSWLLYWTTETGSRIYCLDEVFLAAGIEPRRLFWTEVIARLLEQGARLERQGRIEVKG